MKHLIGRINKGWLMAGAYVASTAVAFAETTPVTDFDTFVTALQTDLNDKMTKVWPVLGVAMIIALGIFIALMVFRWSKTFARNR